MLTGGRCRSTYEGKIESPQGFWELFSDKVVHFVMLGPGFGCRIYVQPNILEYVKSPVIILRYEVKRWGVVSSFSQLLI